MQCSSCGLRYPPEQTLQYSHHLDWHFRQNKKQQESTKKANTRKFYFSVPDWLQYEEIEDVEERGVCVCVCVCVWVRCELYTYLMLLFTLTIMHKARRLGTNLEAS